MTSEQTQVPAGWYLDVVDKSIERYWDGEAFRRGPRLARAHSVEFPEPGVAVEARRAVAGSGLATASMVMYVFAALSAVGSVIGGVELIQHHVEVCSGIYFCSERHPWTEAGWAVLVGGLVQSVIVAVIGYLCRAVHELRLRAEPR